MLSCGVRLKPCPSCSRHVQPDAASCPFCDRELLTKGAGWATATRFGAMVVGAATISTLTGCPRPMPKYGAPPLPATQPEADKTIAPDEADDSPLEPEQAVAPEDDAPTPDPS